MRVLGERMARERQTRKQISRRENTDSKVLYNDRLTRNLSAGNIRGALAFKIKKKKKSRCASLGWTGLGVIFLFGERNQLGIFKSSLLVYDPKVPLAGTFYDRHFLKLVNSVALFFSPASKFPHRALT